jgi:hypothetical protein
MLCYHRKIVRSHRIAALQEASKGLLVAMSVRQRRCSENLFQGTEVGRVRFSHRSHQGSVLLPPEIDSQGDQRATSALYSGHAPYLVEMLQKMSEENRKNEGIVVVDHRMECKSHTLVGRFRHPGVSLIHGQSGGVRWRWRWRWRYRFWRGRRASPFFRFN